MCAVITLSDPDHDRDLPSIIEGLKPLAAAIEHLLEVKAMPRASVVWSHKGVTIPIASGSVTGDLVRRHYAGWERLVANGRDERHV
jgi:hypothetical protein